LRMVLSVQSLLIGGNPMAVTSAYALIAALERREGVHWAMGGTGAIIRAMVKLIESLGGTIQYNTEVKKINIESRAKNRSAKPTAKSLTTQITHANGSSEPWQVRADLIVPNSLTRSFVKCGPIENWPIVIIQ
jgi:phytoene desaturase